MAKVNNFVVDNATTSILKLMAIQHTKIVDQGMDHRIAITNVEITKIVTVQAGKDL